MELHSVNIMYNELWYIFSSHLFCNMHKNITSHMRKHKMNTSMSCCSVKINLWLCNVTLASFTFRFICINFQYDILHIEYKNVIMYSICIFFNYCSMYTCVRLSSLVAALCFSPALISWYLYTAVCLGIIWQCAVFSSIVRCIIW